VGEERAARTSILVLHQAEFGFFEPDTGDEAGTVAPTLASEGVLGLVGRRSRHGGLGVGGGRRGKIWSDTEEVYHLR